MLISEEMYKRWYDLCPGALEAHRPEWGMRKLISPKDQSPLQNLALSAEPAVDSFYGTVNTSNETGLYPILNQVMVRWQARSQPGLVDLSFSTDTPGFANFRWRIDGSAWYQGLETTLCWTLHQGLNRFEIQALNSAGHAGKPCILRLDYTGLSASGWQKSLAAQVESNGQTGPSPIPFLWEDFSHPSLQTLRRKYALDGIMAGAKTDLERVAALRDWVKSRWDHEQPISPPPWDALYFLGQTDKKIESFYCVHYSVTFMQCCLALGIPARLINLGRGICRQDKDRGYGREMDANEPCDEHVVNEVWVDDLGKWVMMDVDFDIHYTHAGVPLNAHEIHRALLDGNLDQLTVHEGPFAYKLRANDRFYQYQLTVYYSHFSVFWRNNHLSDPTGPTRILHWVDVQTPPMLWWEGSDLRHRPQIIGPVGISWPFQLATPRLNDDNLATCWASSEEPEEHWAELRWQEPVTFNLVAIDWALCWQRYWTSSAFRLEAWVNDGWQLLAQLEDQAECAVSRLRFEPVTASRLRLVQPIAGGAAEFPHRLWLAEIEVYQTA